ncbi:Transmembrane emp24 domain-containing protein 7 [Homalodisca vitripennis]|nr:Transmembrane emp24 domain-containing protein 7 [Homalodisca vitripennis]
MEMYSVELHLNLRRVVGYQTHHRLRESKGRKRAEILNERVFWWSLTCTTAILFVSIGQVLILKKFFSGENVDGINAGKLPSGSY